MMKYICVECGLEVEDISEWEEGECPRDEYNHHFVESTELHTVCLRCSHVWVRRAQKLPKVCPKCKSPYWRRVAKRKREEVKRDEFR